MTRYNLVVSGGGPAGTAAAITAARSGARVLLLEQGRFPRHKVCGEFVSGEAFAVLRDLLRPDQQRLLETATKTTYARLFVDYSVVTVPLLLTAASISRYELDLALWQAATCAAIDCRQQVTVNSIASHGGSFQIDTTAGPFIADSAIDATGRWSKLQSHLPAGKRGERNLLGLKAHFKTCSADGSEPCATDLYFFQDGYCGVQPLKDCEINVCAIARADRIRRLEEVFALHPALWKRSQAWTRITDVIATSPLIFRGHQATYNGVLRAGDAAAFIDPFAGDGISMALRSGVLASNMLQSFWSGATTLDQILRNYRDEYSRYFASALLTASRARKLLNAPGLLRRLAVQTLRLPQIAEYMVTRTR